MVAVDAVAPDKAAVVAKFHPLLAHKGPCEADRLYVVPAVQLCNAIEMPGDQITTVKLVRSHCGLLGCLRQHLVNHSPRNGADSCTDRAGFIISLDSAIFHKRYLGDSPQAQDRKSTRLNSSH